MSEWLKEHAWKTIPASRTERHQNTSSRNRFSDLPPQNASRCDPVSLGIRGGFDRPYTVSTQFSAHLFGYVTVFLRMR